MDTWRDIRRLLECQDDPTIAEVIAEITPADRTAAGPTWFARMVEQARPKWQKDGLCVEYDLDFFAAHPVHQAKAKAVCADCLVKAECLDYAIDNGEVGVWGGTTEQERRAMRTVVPKAA